jgi:signal transduction histidine kinase
MTRLPAPIEPSLFKRSIEQAARARLALPVLLLSAALAMAVNEATYQHTTATLSRGIALTDARLEAARTLQALTELEAAARAYVGTRSDTERARFEQAAQQLPRLQDKALGLVAQVDTEGVLGVAAVRNLIDEHAQRLRAWVDATAAAPAVSAAAGFDDARSRGRSAALAQAMDALLTQAGTMQQQARLSLYDAFLLSRVAVHALVLLALLALLMFMRQLRRADLQQAREHERLEGQIRERTGELRDLARHLVSAREDERSHVARELHDEMGGLLTAMKLELARMKRVPALPQAALERVAGFEKRLNDGIALKRRIVEHLRPSSLDQLGLNAALEMLCTDTAAVAGIVVTTRLQPVTLEKDAELSVFRVVQESLTNALKYAHARTVEVRLEATATHALLSVRDDGRGFDPAAVGAGHHGIAGMRLRIETHGGRLEVRSAEGAGTEITARLPLGNAAVSGPSRVAAG